MVSNYRLRLHHGMLPNVLRSRRPLSLSPEDGEPSLDISARIVLTTNYYGSWNRGRSTLGCLNGWPV